MSAAAQAKGMRPATLAKARTARSMISRGFTPAAIAEIESISERRVFQLLAIDCPDEAAPAGAAYLADPEQGAEAPDARATVKPMTRRMMLDRAWTAAFSAGAQAGPTAPMVPSWVTTAAELGEIVGLARAVTVAETETVRTWLEKGMTPDALRGIIHTVLKRENCPASPSLTYFAGAVADALAARTVAPVQAAKSVAEPVPPLSEADKAIEAMIAVPSKAWLNDRSMPFPPTAAAVKEAYAAGREADVRRWLDLFTAWRRAGYPGGSKPPDFNFFIRDPRKYKEQMAEIEGELSRVTQADNPGGG